MVTKKIGCQKVVYDPDRGVISAPRLGVEVEVLPPHVWWEGEEWQFRAWGVKLPVHLQSLEVHYLRALKVFDKLGLWLYAEADSEGNLNGRVAVQEKW